MKIQVAFFGAALAVCLATPLYAQTPVAAGPYVAVTDRNPYPKPALPTLGPAGTTITDPVFQSRITRVTDGNTRPGFLNYSYRTPSSAHQHAWSAAGSYFFVVTDDGTVIPFRFDAATATASRINPTTSGDGGWTVPTYIEPEFSYVTDTVLYGSYNGPGTNLHQIDQFDVATGTTTQLLDLETLVTGLTGTYIGGVQSSAGPTERIETFFGGVSQDHHHYVVVFDRANPSTPLLLDTWASTLNGTPTPITLNFSLHSVFIDLSGRYVMLYPTSVDLAAPRSAAQDYLWDTQTGTITPMTTAMHPDGHDSFGYGVMVNQDCCTTTSWDAAQWQFRSMSTPSVTRDLLPTLITPQEVYMADHSSWNNASPTVLVPFISGTYRYGADTAPWRPLDDEIIAIETDAPGKNPTIWRFAHHRSNVASDLDPTGESFWYEPRPNVSPDGQWVLFTSNWEKTLGTDPDGDTATRARQDVFLVHLQPNTGSTSASPVAIVPTTVPAGRQTVPYSAAEEASGGTGTYLWSALAPLPGGLTVNASTGAISGTPTAAGTYTVTIGVADASNATNTASVMYSVTITPAVQITSPSPLPNATRGVSYSYSLQATSAQGPTTWSLVAGALPPGMTLNPGTGVISGRCKAGGTYSFTVSVKDVNTAATLTTGITMKK